MVFIFYFSLLRADLMVIDSTGEVLLPETKFADDKFEGVEFI